MRRKVHERAPDVPVRFTTAAESLRENLASPRFLTALLAAFAALAVCLAMAGVYGVIAYIVGQRVSEIGLRMALGASRIDVLWLVLREGLIVAAVGLAIGLATSAAATRLLTTMLFEVKPNDPLRSRFSRNKWACSVFNSCYPSKRAMFSSCSTSTITIATPSIVCSSPSV